MEQYITWTGQPSAQLSKLMRPTECRKTQHSMSRWHRTVHIPWLVDSYNTHKGKRWLNSNPQTTGGKRKIIWRNYPQTTGGSYIETKTINELKAIEG